MSYISNEKLPESVKRALPSIEAQGIFRNVFNNTIKAGKTKEVAFATGWATIKRLGYTRDEDGVYIKKERESVSKSFTLTGDIQNRDEEKRLVFGWASISEQDGKPYFDSEDESIESQDLEDCAYDYMKKSRVASINHYGMKIGTVVESMVFTKAKQEALGVDLGKIGWFIGMHIEDDDVWDLVKSGHVKSFSIGGTAKRRYAND